MTQHPQRTRVAHHPYSLDLRTVIAVTVIAVIATLSSGMTPALVWYPIAFGLGYAFGRWARKRAEP